MCVSCLAKPNSTPRRGVKKILPAAKPPSQTQLLVLVIVLSLSVWWLCHVYMNGLDVIPFTCTRILWVSRERPPPVHTTHTHTTHSTNKARKRAPPLYISLPLDTLYTQTNPHTPQTTAAKFNLCLLVPPFPSTGQGCSRQASQTQEGEERVYHHHHRHHKPASQPYIYIAATPPIHTIST